MTLTVRLLASFQIVLDSTVMLELSSRQQALVAYLALHRQMACSRRQVAAALWPETTDTQALKNLRTLIARLRQVLPDVDRLLVITTHSLQWRSDGETVLDVARFQAAAQQAVSASRFDRAAAIGYCETAIAFYTADLLPAAYDEWLIPLREQLRREYLAALDLLSSLLEQSGRDSAAIVAAEQWVRADPANEAGYVRLMRLHLSQADKHAALRTYQAALAALSEDLDPLPGPQLQEMFRQAQAAGEAAPGQGASSRADDVLPAGGRTREPAFVGRERELQWLQAAWQQSTGGAGQLIMLTGEAGIGKTRLVEEWLTRIERQGAPVGRTRCFVGGEALAYAPLGELLRGAAFAPRLRALEPAWIGEVARVLPELLVGGSPIDPPGPLLETWQRQRFLQALNRLVLGTTNRDRPDSVIGPQVLFFDDLQWCDGETLSWLAYLLHAAANSPLLILATLRSEDLRPADTLDTILLALQRRSQFAEQKLGPLSLADAATLAANVGGRTLSQGETRQLYQNTEGNPLFIVETVRAWPQGVPLQPHSLPPKMHAVLRYRLSQLSPTGRKTAEVAAVAGHAFHHALVTAAGGQSEAEAAAGLDELWRRLMLRQSGQATYEFSHDQLRQVAYDAVNPERRRWLHEQIAGALARLHASNLEAMAGQIADHYLQSGHPEKALDYCLLAAGAAARMFAYEEAVAFYQRARTLLPEHDARTIGVLESVGELYRRRGSWQQAQDTYTAALSLLDDSIVLRRATLQHKLGLVLTAANQRAAAWEALCSARALLETAACQREEAWYAVWISVLLEQAEWHYWGGSTDGMAEILQTLQPVMRQYGSPRQQVEWHTLTARMEFRRSRYVIGDAVVEQLRISLEQVRKLGDPLEAARAQFGYGFALLWNGRLEQAGAQLRAALLHARQIGIVLLEAQCLTYLAVIARLSGRLGEARTLSASALEKARATHRLDYAGVAHANLAWLAWRAGDLPAVRQEGAAALENWQIAGTSAPFYWLAVWPLIGASIKEGYLEQAFAYAAMLVDDSQQPQPQVIREQLASAFAAWQAGHGVQARAHLDAAVSAAAARGYL
ncbi:MAG: AAA family ATPase [Caldilineaceae bacterium]